MPFLSLKKRRLIALSDNEAFRNAMAASIIGLMGWHLLTLHNIAKSVDVLVNQMETNNVRIDRLEQRLYFDSSHGSSKE